MPDSSISITEGSGKAVDTRTNAAGDHRQVVVLGNPTATDSVAEVQATDPSSNTLGLVVRDVNTSAIAAQLASGVVISGDINRVRNVVDGTLSTVSRVSNLVDGTLSVVTLIPTVQRVQNLVDGTLTTVTGVDRIRNLVDGTISTVSGVTTVTRVDRVMNIVDGTVSSLGTLTRVDRVMNVVDGTISTVTFVPTVQRVQGIVDGTLTTVAGLDRVRNVVDGTLSTVNRVQNVVDGTLSTVTRVQNVVDGTLSTVVRVSNLIAGTVTLTGTNSSLAVFLDPGHLLGSVTANAGTGSFTVQFDPGHTLGSLVANQSVNAAQFNGGTTVTPNTGIPLINTGSTMQVFTVSGTTSTAGNNTLVAPSASYNFKVFAYSIQGTGIVSFAPRFTTGASAGATELWRPLINAVQTTSTPVGANLAVAPPGYLFATGTNTTLSLYLDTATLIHYSVSYIKESA